MRPRLLDLCCKEGGATRGYQLAGFHVTGVDRDPQPRYVGDDFIQADAIEVLSDADLVSTFDFIHASWPCQGFKKGTLWSDKPDLVTPGRALMRATGLPWVIENVMDAPLDLDRSVVLCGEMFGLRTYRHRRFEPSWCCRRSSGEARPVRGTVADLRPGGVRGARRRRPATATAA